MCGVIYVGVHECVLDCVVARAQLVFRGTNTTSNHTYVSALTANTVSIVSQSSFTATVKGTNFFVGTIYGGVVCVCVCVRVRAPGLFPAIGAPDHD